MDRILGELWTFTSFRLCRCGGTSVVGLPQTDGPWWLPPAPEDFSSDLAGGSPVNTLVNLCNIKAAETVDTITPGCLLPLNRMSSEHCFSMELGMMKQMGWWLEWRWRQVKANIKAYSVETVVRKKLLLHHHYICTEPFRGIFSRAGWLFHPKSQKSQCELSAAHFDLFACIKSPICGLTWIGL